ncbi:MAG: hypothetical protein IJ662_00965, partial [Clostridia bacterium]|nr:hypothetical protein [Clostridia bacterium]
AAAVPAAMGARALLSKYRSKSLLGLRVQERTGRLRALRLRREAGSVSDARPALMPGMEYLED